MGNPSKGANRALAISLIAIIHLVSAPLSYCASKTLAQATNGRTDSNQPDVTALIEESQRLRIEGKYAQAAAIWQKLLSMAEALGPSHPAVATSLNNLAALLVEQGEYAPAEPLYRRALEIRMKNPGQDQRGVVNILNNLADLLARKGVFGEAELLLRRSVDIIEQTPEKEHPAFAHTLTNLGSILSAQGRYAESETMNRRALEIKQKDLGPNHPEVALILNNIGAQLERQGRYSESLSYYRRSLSINEKALGPYHPDVASNLTNIGNLLGSQLGQFTTAEPLLRRALAIREKTLGPNHPDAAISLNSLSLLLIEQGQYKAAEPLLQRALDIREKALGPNHPDVAISLDSLASLLSEQGQYKAAEPLLQRALDIREKAVGPNHPDVAISLNNLGLLLVNRGKYAEAEKLLHRALAISEKALGSNHGDIGPIANNLAAAMGKQGKYAEAEFLYRRSIDIEEKARGPQHPAVATALANLALLLALQESYDRALTTLRTALTKQVNWLIRELPLIPERARSAQMKQQGEAWQLPFELISQYPPAADVALESRLNRQGLLTEIERIQGELINAPGVHRVRVEQLLALTKQLASVSLPSDRRGALRDERDRIQVELYRQTPGLEIKSVTIGQVAKALPNGSVLVEFQRYRPFDNRKPQNQRWGPAQYIALVLKRDGSIESVPLGSAEKIDATIHKGLSASAEQQTDAQQIWAELSQQVLQPLLPYLRESREWFISPDSELNRVPFAALPAPQQPTIPLGEAVQLRLLTTGRELIRLQQPTPKSGHAQVVANPSYDRKDNSTWVAQAVAVPQKRSADLGSSNWKPLPATEMEGRQIAKLLSTTLISGPAATTASLQQQVGPRVLHVATHGFFIANQEGNRNEPLQILQEQTPLLKGLRQEDPQLRSGLVLAGANKPDADPNDDGYLTAAEALSLNLNGTELVVLSACSTGQGTIRTGEGVYGLQRSLTVAGARSTLLSLWKVDDVATAEFMRRYYERLKTGEGRSDALASVQKEFRQSRIEAWRHPYYWAAWQLVGDWRPVPGL